MKLYAALLLLGLSGSVHAQFNTLEAWGNAAGTTPPPSFSGDGSGVTAISAGGADIWGNSDQGAFLWDNTGTYTTTGDFTATARHVGTNDPAPTWGRDGILVRATQAPGAVAANDANYHVLRKSNGQVSSGWRDTAGGGTNRNDGAFSPVSLGPVASTPIFLAGSREGNTLRASYAADLGGTPGRWIEHNNHSAAELDGGNEVIVGLMHQSHPQSGGGSGNGGVNTATYDNWSFTGSYDGSLFGGLPAGEGGDPWNLGGSLNVDAASGVANGSAYVTQGGSATGEPVKWTLTAREFVGYDSGLNADIYLGGNPGNEGGARARFSSPPAGSTVLPNIDWTGNNGTSATNAAPYNQGQPGDLVAATPGFSATNQDSYGVHMQGQIWIPGDADRLPGDDSNIDTVAFKDGIDDYTFLGIDGATLVDDNAWTSYAGGPQNGGSPIATLDVSDPKFDDGEWVSFEMIMWEGGGGDAGVLYWDQNAAGGFPAAQTDPATTDAVVPAANYRREVYGPTSMEMGTDQVGSDTADAPFPLGPLPPGDWELNLVVQNTGASSSFSQSITVLEPELAIYCGANGPGQTYRQDFDGFADGTTDLGDGSQMNGTSSVQGNQLRLTTDGVAGGFASFNIPALAASSTGFTATYDLTITDSVGANPPADGMSFNYGNFGLGELGSAEEGMAGAAGVTENISFEIDSWMNFDGEQGVNIAEKAGGADNNLAFTNGPILNDGTTVGGTVSMSWDPTNGGSFSTAGLLTNAAFSNVATTFAADDAHLFGFSGRVGGANETKLIDNLYIETVGDPQIANGETAPVDYGTTGPGVPISKDFVLANRGGGILNFTGLPTIPADWSIIGAVPTSLAPGEQVAVQLQFDATGPGGVRGGTVSVPTDDPDNPYTFTVVACLDDEGPVVASLKDLVYNVVEGGSVVATWDPPAVFDVKSPTPAPTVSCDPMSGTSFTEGEYLVTCTGVDTWGNTTESTFTIFVLTLIPPESLLEDPPAAVVLGGWDAPAGPAGTLPGGTTLRAVRSAHLNENGNVAVRASLDGGGASTEGVFSDSLASGALELLGAVGLNDVTSLDRVELNDDGDVNFRNDSATQFRLLTELGAGGANQNAGEKAEILLVYKQAQAGGNAAAPATLRRGGPITTQSDSVVILPDTTLIQEGTASPVGGATYGQIAPRVVTNPSGTTMAFTAQLRGIPGATALAVFVGNSDGTGLVDAIRKGDPVPGAGVLSSVASESINEGGDLALRGTVQGPGIGGANNGVLLSNRNGGLELIAREGDDAPCIEAGKGGAPTLKRFDKVFIAGDGAVTFSAFLAGAGVNSSNDGGLWRSDADGSVTLIAREGDIANNTEDVIEQILGCAASTDGKSVFDGRLVVGIGETVTTNRTGLWAMRKVGGPAELLLRQGDTVEAEKGAPKEEEPDPLVLLSLGIDESSNPQGGSGGYGRVISEAGQVVTRLSFSGGTASSGAFLIDLEGEEEEEKPQ